jgi:HK97 family phage prohead protease
VDPIGTRVEIDLPETRAGRDVATSIRRCDMDGMSSSFDVGLDLWDRDAVPPVRRIQRVRTLYDVGPVTYPAYPDTSAAMRSLERSRDPLAEAKRRHAAAEAVRV